MEFLTRFECNEVRCVEQHNERRMSALDVCAALGYSEARAAWSKLKNRNAEELKGYAVVTKLVATDGKQYETDTLNLEGVIRVCMLARTKKAIQFRDWATKILAHHIEQQASLEEEISLLKARAQFQTMKTILEMANFTQSAFGVNDTQKILYCRGLYEDFGLRFPQTNLLTVANDRRIYYKTDIYRHFGLNGNSRNPKIKPLAAFLEKLHGDEKYTSKTLIQSKHGHQGTVWVYYETVIPLIKKYWYNIFPEENSLFFSKN